LFFSETRCIDLGPAARTHRWKIRGLGPGLPLRGAKSTTWIHRLVRNGSRNGLSEGNSGTVTPRACNP